MAPREWSFVAREAQLARISAILDGESEPRGVMVIGPSGVGRTRLLAEVMRRRGGTTLTVIASLASLEAPLAPLLGISGGINPVDEAGALAELSAQLRTAKTPVTLIADDVQTLPAECARVIAAAVIECGARLLASAEMGTTIDPALRFLQDSGAVARVDLAPLTREESYALVRSVIDGEPSAAFLGQLWRASRGNIAVLHDSVQHAFGSGRLDGDDGALQFSASLDAISHRLAHLRSTLDTAEQNALDWIALTEPAPLALFEDVVSTAALDSLQARGIAASHPSLEHPPVGLLHVAQPLLGESLRSSFSAARSEQMHRRVLAIPPPVTPYGRLRSLVWAVGTGTEFSAIDAISGAELAGRMHDYTTADTLATAAIEHLEHNADNDAATLVRALHARAYAARFDDDSERALVDLRRAADVLRAMSSTAETIELRATTIAAEADALHYGLGELDAALQMIQSEARNSVSASPGLRSTALRLTAERLSHLAFGGRFREYRDEQSALPRMPRRLHARLSATTAICRAAAGEPASAVRMLQRVSVHRGIRPSQRGWVAEELSGAMFSCLLQARGPAGVEKHVDTIDIDGADHFVRFMDGVATLAVAGFHIMRGDLDRGRPEISAAVTALEQHDPSGMLARAYSLAAEAAALDGDPVAAADFAARARREPLRTSASLHPDIVRSLTFVTASLEGVEAAVAESHRESARMRGDDLPGAEAIMLQNALRFGDPESMHRMIALADRLDGPLHRAFVDYARALQGKDAQQLMVLSLRFDRLGMLVHALEAAHAASSAAEAQGLVKLQAESARRFALLRPSIARVRTPALPDADTFSLDLTPRAREIAALVARGATNRDIARRLHLSVRTVEGHLGRVYAKLGISGRQDLTLIRALAEEPAPAAESGPRYTQGSAAPLR